MQSLVQLYRTLCVFLRGVVQVSTRQSLQGVDQNSRSESLFISNELKHSSIVMNHKSTQLQEVEPSGSLLWLIGSTFFSSLDISN